MNNNFNEHNDKNLLKMFQKQFKAQLLINVFVTVIGVVIILSSRSFIILLLVAITLTIYWLYTLVKLAYLKRAIKKLKASSDLTTLSNKEKETALEATIEETKKEDLDN